MNMKTIATTLPILAGLAVAMPSAADTPDVVNDALGGTPLHSNGGLDAQNFSSFSGGGTSLSLRSRSIDGIGQPSTAPNTSATATGFNTYAVGDNGQFTVDFQFTPGAGATTMDNYFLKLEIDNDASIASNFTTDNTFQGAVFDADTDDELLDDGRFGPGAVAPQDSSWDDGDSVVIDGVTTRGGQIVDFASDVFTDTQMPEYVVSQSWNAQWDFPNFSLLGDDFGGPVDEGFYDIRLSVFDEFGGTQLASGTITANVPAPTTAAILGLGGLAAARRRR